MPENALLRVKDGTGLWQFWHTSSYSAMSVRNICMLSWNILILPFTNRHLRIYLFGEISTEIKIDYLVIGGICDSVKLINRSYFARCYTRHL